jgi:hypothetical protein
MFAALVDKYAVVFQEEAFADVLVDERIIIQIKPGW